MIIKNATINPFVSHLPCIIANLCVSGTSNIMSKKLPVAPIAKREPTEIRMHDDVRVDEYDWLRSRCWQEMLSDSTRLEPEIRRYLEEENTYTEAVMADSEGLQQTLYEELKGRIKEDDMSIPDKDGDYEYYRSYHEGEQHPIYCRRLLADQSEEVLLDVNQVAQGKAYLRIENFSHSPDHRYISYCADDNGSEYFTLYLRDTHTDTPAQPLLKNLHGDFVWSADSRHIFYLKLNEAHRPDTVFRYCLDDTPQQAEVVYKEADPGFFVNLYKTRSGRFIVIFCYDHSTSEAWLIPSDAPNEAPRVMRPRELNVKYITEECRGKLVIHNNSAGAENFKLSVADPEKPAVWHDIYVPKPDVLLEEFMVFKDYLVCIEQQDALTHISLTPSAVVEGQVPLETQRVAFDEPCYQVDLIKTFEYDSKLLRFQYSSLKTPRHVYDYDMQNHSRKLRKVQQIPSGHDVGRYSTQRLWARGEDDVAIPISVLHLKSTRLDGSAPLLLYAYGAYGYSMPASFLTTRFSLVDRGFIYAIAHVRGGVEKGYAWYRTAKFNQKKNTFHDFIACAECLVDKKLSYRGGIAIQGASAGGMNIGYAVNTAADLFKAAIAEVPFVDVLNTMCDADLPLTPPEWQEWGNPIDDHELYRYMKSYSPYDQVKPRRYPNMLVTAGLNDPRVSYWEPTKWVAKLRACKKDNNYLLLKVNMGKGHSTEAGRFDQLKELAFQYAFLLKSFGKSG